MPLPCPSFDAAKLHEHCLVDTKDYLHWQSFASGTDLVPTLVREVVHTAPQQEQFGRLLGLAKWLTDVGVQPLFNVVPPSLGGVPQHATLLWSHQQSTTHARLSTANIPQDCAQELWCLSGNGPWERLIQPSHARYQLSMDMVPADNTSRLLAAFAAWMQTPEAPVCLARVNFSKTVLDISPWVTSLPSEKMAMFVLDAWNSRQLSGHPLPSLLEVFEQNGVSVPGDNIHRLGESSIALPSPARIAQRRHDLLQDRVDQLASPRTRSLRL